MQQAVAGVESRLDNILAEEDTTPVPKKPTTPTASTTPGNVSRAPSSSNRTNDRLQERLARAIAAKSSQQKPADKVEKADSLALSSGTPSRTGSPATVADSPRQSIDATPSTPGIMTEAPISQRNSEDRKSIDQVENEVPSIAVEPGSPLRQSFDGRQKSNGLTTKVEVEVSPRVSMESTRSSIPRASMDSIRQSPYIPLSSVEVTSNGQTEVNSVTRSAEETEALLKQLQSDFETAELQRQEETHSYIERIDALQSKLQYLAKESAEVARKNSDSAPSGSLDKKLAAKDEQIALLMQEGQLLSKKELAHMTTIKKLRAKVQEDSKEIVEIKKKQEKAERDAALAAEHMKRAESSARRANEKQKQINQLQKDFESMKADRDSKDSIISDLKRQLNDAATQEKEAEAKAIHEALETERKKVADLEDDLANLKIEKNLIADRAQLQIKELREKVDKDTERARMAELEMKNEQQILEGKLEVMRARAEEVSSGTTGDAQAKLLRQIETLQSQYAVASENWQGIEASLIARATSLERERDDATRREADIRRKAREVTLKAKRHEDELEETRSKLPTFNQELADQKAKLDSIQRRAEEAEAALVTAKVTFEQEKKAWQTELSQRIEEERGKWQEEAGSLGHSRAESPVASMRRGLTTEFLGLQNLQLRRASARSVNSDSPGPDRLLNRRPSAQVLGRGSGSGTPVRQDSAQSFSREKGEDVASIHTDHDDFFENTMSPASPHQTINDMVSISTAGAGPSVQLVERMSSAVRRLESEKVATKEDLARLASQRDEARAEIVMLMREVQQKRDAEAKVAAIEAEKREINDRYETTLEMLGEKSEQVEELKGDIDDIKAMYRELVERTVK